MTSTDHERREANGPIFTWMSYLRTYSLTNSGQIRHCNTCARVLTGHAVRGTVLPHLGDPPNSTHTPWPIKAKFGVVKGRFYGISDTPCYRGPCAPKVLRPLCPQWLTQNDQFLHGNGVCVVCVCVCVCVGVCVCAWVRAFVQYNSKNCG